jgi:hypothetical protein
MGDNAHILDKKRRASESWHPELYRRYRAFCWIPASAGRAWDEYF